jgi:hypothetical protein
MAQQFTVWAYSQKANQSLRQFQLNDKTNVPMKNLAEAKLWAESFAIQLNKQARLEATDWVGRVEYQELGIQTYVDAMNKLTVTPTVDND